MGTSDTFARQHFLAWCKNQRLRLDTRRAMWAIFQSDREYWADRGWPAVLDAAIAGGAQR